MGGWSLAIASTVLNLGGGRPASGALGAARRNPSMPSDGDGSHDWREPNLREFVEGMYQVRKSYIK